MALPANTNSCILSLLTTTGTAGAVTSAGPTTAATAYHLATGRAKTHWDNRFLERTLCILLGAVDTPNPNLFILTSNPSRCTPFTFGAVGDSRFWFDSMCIGRSLVSATAPVGTYG
jgi:hypothetical protein